jgi:hypothetical protein
LAETNPQRCNGQRFSEQTPHLMEISFAGVSVAWLDCCYLECGVLIFGRWCSSQRFLPIWLDAP